MTMLIPDARRGLLGGLIDDASLLSESAPEVDRAVEAYRALRTDKHGWMVGRLVVPASLLEDLAGVLVRTMKAGDAPMPVVAEFDGSIASDASKAATFHATMEPAARIEIVRLTAGDGDAAHAVVEAANATRGIHHDVVPMIPVSRAADVAPVIAAVSAAKAAVLHSVGVVLALPPDATDATGLASSLRACVAGTVPFTIQAEWFPASTLVDPSTGHITVGVTNLLAAALDTGATPAETISILSDDEPGIRAITFAGIATRGGSSRAGRSIGTNRSPLLSLSALEPAATIEALRGLDPFA